MSYTINLTNGTTLATVSDGSVDTSHSSLTLIGKDYAGYGAFLNENFVYLLENFANTSSPANPLKGQLWWDATNNVLKVYSGASWKISTGATSAPYSAPPGDLSALGGDLWFDTTNNQLKVWSGSVWVVVGPQAAGLGLQTTGAFATTISDTLGGSHKIIQLQFNGIIYAIFAYETFSTSISGFSTIIAGLNFSTTASPSWALSNQSTTATPNTIIQRDSSAGANVAALTATSITAATINATSTINGTFNGSLTGNVTATTISASGTILAGGVTATSGFSGSVLTASQPGITAVGTLTGLTVGSGTVNFNNGGAVYINGVQVATVGGSSSSSFIDNQPIGANVASTGQFTTLTVNTVAQPVSNLAVSLGTTSRYWNNAYVGNVIAGSVSGGNFVFANSTSVISAAFNAVTGSTGGIPNSALANSSVVLNGTTVSLGNTYSISAAASTLTGTTLASGVTASSLTSVGTLAGLTVSAAILPSANASINLGSVSSWFNNIYGSAIHAQYADLAERFWADAEYPAGTVVEMGGINEITKVVEECSERVFGVISTNAAYLMNSGAGTDATHPPIAMSGRVPVRVIGLIAKGDRLVSAGNGMARTGLRDELTAFNVIGRALENKTTAGEGVIEAIVKLNS